jgi:hypothetical protein
MNKMPIMPKVPIVPIVEKQKYKQQTLNSENA